MRCVAESGAPVCECNAGTHDAGGGSCVPDESCLPTSCSGHGACDDAGEVVSCDCEPGWAGPYCTECDADAGYHADGVGGCSSDLCVPDPCMGAHRTCESDGDVAICACETGYHEAQGECVADPSCDANSCGSHGDCDDSDGVIRCACEDGYSGDDCKSCDLSVGYHDDGVGGCTDDACLPNPCSETNKSECTATGGVPAVLCACDGGYHDDGTGGCTDEPCLPNPCAASGMACRDNGDGSHACFTPDCDDGNPCTDDTNVAGECTHDDRDDWASCSTTLCTGAQTCTVGVCGGGSTVDCADDNDCTDDSCDEFLGCQNLANDARVPDDGVSCTADLCSGGVATHSPRDLVCDDGLFCSGVEVCAPDDAAADADGCAVVSIPIAPASEGPCRHYGACDEATASFLLVVEEPGTACNDGVACTDGTVCTAAGVCLGELTQGCDIGGGGCTSTVAWPRDIDFSVARVSGALTFNGGAPPSTSESSVDADFYVINKSTGSRQSIGSLRYSGAYPCPLVNSPEYSAVLVPGVYDVLSRRSYLSSSNAVYTTDVDDNIANGNALLDVCLLVSP